MTRSVALCILVVYVASWIVLSLCQPWVLSDENEFLESFVNHEFLGFMGVVVTITLASATNIHIELKKLEAAAEMEFLSSTRRKVRQSAFALIWSLFLSVVVVVAKPLLTGGQIAISLANGAALLLILVGILVLVDLTKLAFNITPIVKE